MCLSHELQLVTNPVSAGPLVHFPDVLKVTSQPAKVSFSCIVSVMGKTKTGALTRGLQERGWVTKVTTKLRKGPRLPKSEVGETSQKTSRKGKRTQKSQASSCGVDYEGREDSGYLGASASALPCGKPSK